MKFTKKYSFIAYECNHCLYLKLNICPYCKYFVFQESEIKQNPNYCSEIYNTFDNGNVKWILLNRSNRDLAITDIINNKYECKVKYNHDNSHYELYRIKTNNNT